MECEFTPVNSSHINGAHYDSLGAHLTLRFKNGAEYTVHGVSQEQYEEFLAAPSPGQHLHGVLKHRHLITQTS